MHDRRVALVCIVVLMGCCSVAAQGLRGAKLRSKQEVKTGCISGNCQDGEGEFEMDGEKYKGAFKDGLKEGHGLDRTHWGRLRPTTGCGQTEWARCGVSGGVV
jgi:hypothetical protein